MCPNWICTVGSPYGEGEDRKQRPDIAARLGADGRAPNGGIWGDTGDPARAGGLVLATPRPPAPAAAGAPERRSPPGTEPAAPSSGSRLGAGAGGPHPRPFSPPRTQSNKLEACSTRPAPGGPQSVTVPREVPKVPLHGAPCPARCLPRGLGGGRRQEVGARSPQPRMEPPGPARSPRQSPGEERSQARASLAPGGKEKGGYEVPQLLLP